MASVGSTSTLDDLPPPPPAPRLAMAADGSPVRDAAVHSSPVRSLVSRFEKKQEQSLDALPFRTVRSFFGDGDERSVHVTSEKQKYDALTEKQRAEAEARRLQRSPEGLSGAARRRVFSNASPADDGRGEDNQQAEDEPPAVVRKLEMEFDDELNDALEEHENPQHDGAAPPPPPPPPQEEQVVVEQERKQFVNTPEQETKKRPILTTERSFVMEEDHTIETEDLIVVGERFSTDGEDDREMLMEMLERELNMTPEDEAELRHALEMNPSRARMLRRAYKYRRPENVPSKLFAPTAASLASRTTKSPSAVKREPKKAATPTTQTAAAASPAATPTRKSTKYANVQSKVKEMMKPTTPSTPSRPSRRRESDASDVSHTSSRSSMGGSGLTPSKSSTKANQQNGLSPADRRSSMPSRTSRRSSASRSTLLDIHGADAHADWEGRHRSERLSFASSTSSTDSTDPLALHLSFSSRKSRYDSVQPRYLDYGKQSATYTRNKEAQLERRRKLEEANAAKSAERQKQLQFQIKLKEKREKEDLEQAVRRGEELHKMTQLLKEKEKEEENERRKSQSAIRRALSGTGSLDGPSVGRRGTPTSSSIGASSPRTSLLSEPDSIPSSATSGATTNTVLAA